MLYLLTYIAHVIKFCNKAEVLTTDLTFTMKLPVVCVLFIFLCLGISMVTSISNRDCVNLNMRCHFFRGPRCCGNELLCYGYPGEQVCVIKSEILKPERK